LEKVITDCGTENEHAAWLVLYLLTDENDNRPLKTRAELAVESAIESQKLDLILEILEKSGLVFLLPEVPTNRYQLVHDYLVEFIRQKEQLNIQTELQELRKKDKQRQDEIDEIRAELLEKELRAKLAKATEQQRNTEDKLNQVLTQSLRKARLVGVALATLTVIAGVLGVRAAISDINAQLSEMSASSEALLASNKEFDALVESLRAGKQLKRSFGVTPSTKIQVERTLQQAIDKVSERNRLEGHIGSVNSVSFSPDDKMIATASEDGTIKLWNREGTLLKTLKSQGTSVTSVSFSPDGQTLVTASANGTVSLWSREGTLLKTLKSQGTSVTSVSFSPDGQTLVTASANGTVSLWSREGTLLKTLKSQGASVTSVSFSPDGQTLVTASANGTVSLWSHADTKLQNSDDIDRLLEQGCNWLHDYLKTNPNANQSDRHLCDGIPTRN
jgi:flagellar hook assembly protein FlgD